jgi:hypothetical protein
LVDGSLPALRRVGLGQRRPCVIALIAADRLTPSARAEIADLLGGGARESMAEASTWADVVRRNRPETAPWQPGRGTSAPIILPQDYAVRERSVTAIQLEKAGVRLAVLLNNALATPARSATVETIAPEAASAHIGETAIIKGIVADVHRSRSGVIFLDMGNRYPENVFTAVIFSEDAVKFADLDSLRGKTVQITGLVRRYRGSF